MPPRDLSERTFKQIDKCVELFTAAKPQFEVHRGILVSMIESAPALRHYVHTVRSRVKNETHLRYKLIRQARKALEEGASFDTNPANLFVRVTDLLGVRILHLHTRQIGRINTGLKTLLDEFGYLIVEGPEANTWDDEYREFFDSVGITVTTNQRMYTSVHYVVRPNLKSELRCEIQVRTLHEEIWNEVSHLLNYPTPSSTPGCEEQIRALARVSSGFGRLVEAIFASNLTADGGVDHDQNIQEALREIDLDRNRRRAMRSSRS